MEIGVVYILTEEQHARITVAAFPALPAGPTAPALAPEA
jgi:hypothetical protein